MNESDEIKRLNLQISLKFNKIELELAEAKGIAGIFETLFRGIEREFAVPFVWLTLVDSPNAIPITTAVKKSASLIQRLKVIPQDVFTQLFPAGLQPVLVNKDLHPYYKLLPPIHKYFVKSLALVPFQIHGEIVGSWNNGDSLSERYLPDMDTGLLQKLAQKVSFQLGEIISGKK